MRTVVAIDGPAASGKSTTARLVAQKLGYVHLDTGAMYRVVTLACLEKQLPPKESPEMADLLSSLEIRFQTGHDGWQSTWYNKRDVTETIRRQEISQKVSAYSALPMVRSRMVKLQRQIGAEHDVVCEGRDIGTLVFPDARFKFYLTADLDVRAKRRHDELSAGGSDTSLERIVEELQQRDLEDSTRELSPLHKAEDAMVVDTTDLTIPAQVDYIVTKVKDNLKHPDSRSINKEKQTQNE